jgi:hypothetical protein
MQPMGARGGLASHINQEVLKKSDYRAREWFQDVRQIFEFVILAKNIFNF